MTIIRDYLYAGFALVPIPYGKKGPQFKGWNRKDSAITAETHPSLQHMGNVGLAHAYCKPYPTAVLDIDQFNPAGNWLAEHGIDLQSLLDDQSAVQIVSGRAGRAKLLYVMPPGTGPRESVMVEDGSQSVILEFRCATRAGLTVQDVIPPSIHPLTGQPYSWGGYGNWRTLPTIPSALLAAWVTALTSQRKSRAGRQQGITSTKFLDDTPRQRARVSGMLSYISADCAFDIYRAIVWAILSLGWSDAEQLAEQWCRTAPHRYEQDNFERLVDDFDVALSPSMGTIDYHARKGGWNG